MPRRTLEQRIESAKRKKEQSENQLKLLIQKQKTEERKTRTKRLIDRGAILESLIDGATEFTNDQIAIILKKTVGSPDGMKIIAETTKQKTEKPITIPQGETPKRNDEAAESQIEIADDDCGIISAPRAEIETDES